MFDAHLHVPKLIDGRIIKVSAVDEGLNFLNKLGPHLRIAGDRSSLDQCRALPALTPGFIVNHGGANGLNQRSTGPHGTKPEVDPKDKPILSDLPHGMDDFFADACEEFSRCRFPFRATRTLAFIVLVKKNHVDIGAEVQLPASELSHSKDYKPVRRLLTRQ